MYKKIVKNVLLAVIVFFGFNTFVNASSIYDYLEPHDVIIGNTTFRSGTWISATRASKAGSLYTMINGDTDVKTYKYIAQEVWFEMDPETDAYRPLSKDEIAELNDTLYINFLNNEPLMKTYKAKIVEEDEFSGGPNAVHDFFNYLEGDKFVDEEAVILDYQNQTITCEFNTVFEFSVVQNDVAEYYTGFCDSEFRYLPQYNGEDEPYNPYINIVSSKLAEDDEFLNQDKVTLIDRNETTEDGVQIYYPANYITFKINEKLDRFSYDEENYVDEGKYLVFDFEIDGDTNNIRDIISYEENYTYEILDEHNFRLFVEIEDRWEQGYQNYFLLNYAGTYTNISLSYEGLELPDTDFELLNLKPANIDMEGNNQSLIDDIKYDELSYTDEEGYTYKNKFYNVYTIGDLNYFDFGDYYAAWIAFELEFDSDILYLDEIEINSSGDYYYEIKNEKILLWIAADTFVDGNFVELNYIYTNGKSSDRVELKVNNYYEERSIDYNNEVLGLYTYHYYDTEDVKVKLEKVTSNWSSYNDLYYKKNEKKLYYKDISSSLFRDSESFKEFNVIDGEVYVSELVGILCDIDPAEGDKAGIGGISYKYGLANSDFNSFESFDDDFDPLMFDEGTTHILYYFFNREKTEAELETITNLEELGVEVVDLSDYYYGEIQE